MSEFPATGRDLDRQCGMRRRRMRQAEFEFPQWGGARQGAGRPPKDPRNVAIHDTRPPSPDRLPVHVTLSLLPGLPSLRSAGLRQPLERCLSAAAHRFGCRLIHYSIQVNHLHVIAEASDVRSLSRAVKGLCVRIARRLNRLWRRKGQVFRDRFHLHVLRTPREVRHALAYCLTNVRKHGRVMPGLDPYSSGRWFDGWKEVPRTADAYTVLARPQTWLLKTGWRQWGLIAIDEEPSARQTAAAIRRAKRLLEKR